jgi:multidrug efflux pump subunit AcrA (membrane-fusion protein)
MLRSPVAGTVLERNVVEGQYVAADTPLFGLAECNRLLGQGVAAVDYYARYVASTASDVREDLRAEARKRLGELRR